MVQGGVFERNHAPAHGESGGFCVVSLEVGLSGRRGFVLLWPQTPWRLSG